MQGLSQQGEFSITFLFLPLPLDGRKTYENNKNSQMGQITYTHTKTYFDKNA